MAPSKDEFFPEPFDLVSLDDARPNYRLIGEGVGVVVLVRGGGLSIFRDLCPHMGGSMSEGIYRPGEGTLQCPWHGYNYSADTGEFVKNPNDAIFDCMKGLYKSYKPEAAPKYKLAALSHVIKEGRVYVRRPGAA